MFSVHAMRHVQLRFNPARSLGYKRFLGSYARPAMREQSCAWPVMLVFMLKPLHRRSKNRSFIWLSENREPMFSLTGKIGTRTSIFQLAQSCFCIAPEGFTTNSAEFRLNAYHPLLVSNCMPSLGRVPCYFRYWSGNTSRGAKALREVCGSRCPNRG
jgi:hypothetical protein